MLRPPSNLRPLALLREHRPNGGAPPDPGTAVSPRSGKPLWSRASSAQTGPRSARRRPSDSATGVAVGERYSTVLIRIEDCREALMSHIEGPEGTIQLA